MQTTTRNHFIPLFQLFQHFIMRFLTLALRRNDQKPHAHEEQNDRQESRKSTLQVRVLLEPKQKKN